VVSCRAESGIRCDLCGVDEVGVDSAKRRRGRDLSETEIDRLVLAL
jgi:hypothetical protein